jgi:hypothetical protein
MPEDDPAFPELDSARAELDRARRTRDQLLFRQSVLQSQTDAASRLAGRQDQRLPPLQRELEEVNRRLEDARAEVRGRQARLGQLIGERLRDRPPGAEVATLSAEFPLLLFPVRLETRFDTAADQSPILKIRVYPDEIMADLHEPQLTPAEFEAGKAYWQSSWQQGEHLAAWQTLTAGRDARRAAWVARQTEPENWSQRPQGQPAFRKPQDNELRSSVWTRAAQSHVLPDRWIALAYRQGILVRQAAGGPVTEPLALTLDPNAAPGERTDAYGDGFSMDDGLVWTIHFDRAKEAGMAFEMALDPEDLRLGFTRLLVLGVKSTLTPRQASERLADLIENHHYTRGLAFVPQGTPTNNSKEKPSGYPPPDPNGEASFKLERQAPAAAGGGDGARFMRALGVEPGLADHLAFAGLTEQRNARAMNEALFPVTLGYFLEEMMRPQFDARTVEAARSYFKERVRARGHYPAFRVGSNPYGLLPVSSLSRWRPDRDAAGAERELPTLLRQLRPVWADGALRVPHVGLTNDPDADLTRILAMEASAREIYLRKFIGKDTLANLMWLMNQQGTPVFTNQGTIEAAALERIGHPEWKSRVLELTGLGDALIFRHQLVTDDPLSETEPLPAKKNYIAHLAAARTVDAILGGFSGVPASTLLYQLLRHATLRECYRVVFNLLVEYNEAKPEEHHDRELNILAASASSRATPWQHLAKVVPTVTGRSTVSDFILAREPNKYNFEMTAYQSALAVLKDLPTAELERLLTETLDVCSHRLDAWITSLPGARLEKMRELNPTGTHLGAFAWVEDLRPAPAARRVPLTLADGRRAVAQQDNGGYIHAPSMPHAAAAAILRNAYLSHLGTDPRRYEINLSSERVREAKWLLDGVRQGQPTGAVLGYLFERGLHESRLDQYIDEFRKLYPVVINPPRDTGQPTEAIAARNVVDGLKLRAAWVSNSVPWGAQGLPGAGADRAQIEEQLRRLEAVFDPLADLILAESVYQLAQSNMFAASASLEAMAGSPPPDPGVARQPRTGYGLTHRVALLLGEPGLPAPGTNPRSKAEPFLSAWVGKLLGDLNNSFCRVGFEGGATADIKFAALGLDSLDVLALARTMSAVSISSKLEPSELDRRVRDVAAGLNPGAAVTSINYDLKDKPSFLQVLELAAAAGALLAFCRPLRAEDLQLPHETKEKDAAAAPLDDGRADALLTDFENAFNDLGVIDNRLALRRASLFGIGQAYPFTADADLPDQVQAVRREMRRRLDEAKAGQAKPVKNPAAIARALLGDEFIFLTPFQPAGAPAAEFQLALQQGAAGLGADDKNILKWMQQASRVRPALAAWRKLSLYTNARGGAPPRFDLAQLPFDAGARWAALPFAPNAPPAAGPVSFALHRPAPPAAGQPWVGLLVDEWAETIPKTVETTAVGLHYDDPGAEAAQAVLIAVPPDAAERWDLETLADILNETADLAKIRGVDLELLGPLGQLVPAIYLATDVADNTFSIDFSTSVKKSAAIVSSPAVSTGGSG